LLLLAVDQYIFV